MAYKKALSGLSVCPGFFNTSSSTHGNKNNNISVSSLPLPFRLTSFPYPVHYPAARKLVASCKNWQVSVRRQYLPHVGRQLPRSAGFGTTPIPTARWAPVAEIGRFRYDTNTYRTLSASCRDRQVPGPPNQRSIKFSKV